MSGPVTALLLLIAAACLLVLWRIRRERRRQAYYVSRVRSSDMYGHLYPLLLRCSRRSVESITIRPESVCIRLYRPAGRTLLYTFDKHGFDPLEPDTLLALAQAVAVDFPLLQDRARYTFRTHTDAQVNGIQTTWYDYMITTAYKDSMLRPEYMDKSRA